MIDTIVGLSRRRFLTQASYFGAFYAATKAVPFPAIAASLSDDPRIASTPLLDAGYAAVWKIGEGAYATISDPTKGLTTMCNGGFVFGKDGALLVEGFVSANGAALQMEALRKVTRVPAAGALDTHYHFDHSCGNSFYGANGIQLWAHAATGKRIADSYGPIQATDKAAILGAAEKKVQDAKSDLAKEHAESYVKALGGVIDIVKKTTLTLPNRPLDPAKLPLNVDLGEYPIVIESFPGHSGTDLIVKVPGQKVVYTGDLIFNGSYPACFDEQATISGWQTTLKTFASYDKETIFVPGHGHICGQDGVALLRSVFDDISEQVEKMYKAGVPANEAGDRYVVPEKFKTLSMFSWNFCVAPAVTKLYGEWGAK